MALTRWHVGNREVIVSHKSDAITISLTGEELVSFDLEGRYLGSYDHGKNIRRGLDNAFQLRWRESIEGGDRLRQRTLSGSEAERHYEEVRQRVERILDDSQAGTAHPETLAVIRRASSIAYGQLESSAREFSRLYGHIPILPPDQYRALVIQATDGCTYNQCTFCTLYRDKTFRVRTPEAFRKHIHDVIKYLGRGLSYRKSVFLGDANAIALSTEKLVTLLEVTRNIPEIREIVETGGMHAFLDIYTGVRKEISEYRILKELGLQRVSLGVETGSEELLAFVNKPGSRRDILAVVNSLKESGLAVVVILMVGLGGKKFQEEHLERSVNLIRQFPMGPGDIVYLSQFTPKPEAPYLQQSGLAGADLLTAEEIVVETQRWKQQLLAAIGKRGIKVAPYSFQRFIY